MKKCNCKKHRKHKKTSDKKRKSCNQNPYSEAVIPPCAEYLKNDNVLLINGDLLYINNNKLYAFISSNASNQNSEGDSSESLNTNIEISMTTFIIGLFINQIQKGIIKYDEDKPIHQDKKIDSLIHQWLEESLSESETNQGKRKSEEFQLSKESENPDGQANKSSSNEESKESGIAKGIQIEYSLNFIISNGNAIVNFVTYTLDITELNYIILFTLNRLEGDPGLYFANNGYATPIPANIYLAGLNIRFGRNNEFV